MHGSTVVVLNPQDTIAQVLKLADAHLISTPGKLDRVSRLHERCKKAAFEFRGCVGVVEDERVEAIVQLMDRVITAQNDLIACGKGFRNLFKRKKAIRELEGKVDDLVAHSQRASSQREMIESQRQVKQSEDLVAAYRELESATRRLEIDPVQFARDMPVMFKQFLQEMNLTAPAPTPTPIINNYSGAVTIIQCCHSADSAPGATTSAYPVDVALPSISEVPTSPVHPINAPEPSPPAAAVSDAELLILREDLLRTYINMLRVANAAQSNQREAPASDS